MQKFLTLILSVLLSGIGAILGVVIALRAPQSTAALDLWLPLATFLVLGLMVGALLRTSGFGAAFRAFALVCATTTAVGAVVWAVGALGGGASGAIEALAPTHYQWLAVFVLASLITVVVPARPRKGVRNSAIQTMPEYQIRPYLERKHFLLTEAEVEQLRNSPRGFECGICKTEQDPESSWLYRFLQCSDNPSHVFHALHFKELQWRCPKCRVPVVIESDEP